MRIAYFSPLNPIRSGISDYSEELLPSLAKYAQLDLFVDSYLPSSPVLRSRFAIFDVREFDSRWRSRRYDLCLYQMGNHACHASAYRALQNHPGLTVLHDFYLHHLVVSITAALGDEDAYVREMGYCHGRQGIDSARQALAANHCFAYDRFPANRRVVDASFGIIVHSQYTRQLLAQSYPARPVQVVPQIASADVANESSRWTRSALGLDDHVIFGSFGQITPTKRLAVALRAFREVHARVPRSHYLIVGDAQPGMDIDELIAKNDLAQAVIHTGYLPKSELLACINLIDIGINLRWPILGETSGSLLRLLAAGKPTIVTDAGPFAEFPDYFCPKVPVGTSEEALLAERMVTLARDVEARRAMGEAARAYVREHHSTEECARRYVDFFEYVLNHRLGDLTALGNAPGDSGS